MASSCVLIFAVIGHNTINIPEIFQVFTVFRRTINLEVRGPGEKSSRGKGGGGGDKIEWYRG